MEFVQNNLSKESNLNSAPLIDTVKANENIIPPAITQNDTAPKTTQAPAIISETPIADPNPIQPTPVIIQAPVVKKTLEAGTIFYDINKNSKLFAATKYLYESAITK
jgi:hypothetical protein